MNKIKVLINVINIMQIIFLTKVVISGNSRYIIGKKMSPDKISYSTSRSFL